MSVISSIFMLTWYPLLLLSNYYFIIGRNYDIKFIYDQGHTVVGVDISHIAIEAFFDGNDLEYTVEDIADSATPGRVYKNMDGKIILYCCDIFKFSQNLEAKFQGVWDRASLYAINKSDRRRYVEILRNVCVDDSVYFVETVEKPLLNRIRNRDPPHYITGKWAASREKVPYVLSRFHTKIRLTCPSFFYIFFSEKNFFPEIF